ncbi:MAG: adenylate/guanylate cyclase domain-containing protein [Ghiorsea sp.]
MNTQNNNVTLVVMDKDKSSATYLEFILKALQNLELINLNFELPISQALADRLPHICLFNHYADDASVLDKVTLIHMKYQSTLFIALAAPGLAHKQVEQWHQSYAHQHLTILDKPLHKDVLISCVMEAVNQCQQDMMNQQQLDYLKPMQPSMLWLEETSGMRPGEAVLSEMTVLFTDIRQSTQRIFKDDPKDFLCGLNDWLGLQTQRVYEFEGSVVKYTGDGLLAIFEGGARKTLAIKCAQRILKDKGATDLPTGIGIADGLVMGGVIGADMRYQFDVVGASVHLASRFCGLAQAWEAVVATSCLDHVVVSPDFEKENMSVKVKGFEHRVEVSKLKEIKHEN